MRERHTDRSTGHSGEPRTATLHFSPCHVKHRGLHPSLPTWSSGLGSHRSRTGDTVGPRADAHAVAGAVGERPVRWGIRIVNDAAPGGEGGTQACLDVFARNGYIDVHRVPQWLGLLEILHPDCRPMAERVDGVVVVLLGVPED